MSETTPSGLAGSSTATTKKRKIASTGRKESACWGSFEKIELPEERQKALQRNYDGKCLACGTVVTGKPSELNRHLSACKEIGLSDQLVALTHATAKGASSASSSGQQNKMSSPMKKYLDKAAIGPHEMRRLQLLLALCFVMCGWSFRSVESPFLMQFCQNLRPNFECPSKCKACFCFWHTQT